MPAKPIKASPSRPTTPRHGIAMVLVLVALLVTTVLVGAALTSRDNAPALGDNAATATEATWSAESAANFAVGAIAQSPDLANLLGGDDSLTQTMSVNGAEINVTVTNLLGDPPADGDRELIVTATANLGGIEKTVSKHLTVIRVLDVVDAVDPLLDEFAIFADSSMQIQNGAHVGVWNLSPEAKSAAVAKIGLGFSDLVMMDLGSTVNLNKVGLYADVDAAIPLENDLASRNTAKHWIIPIDVPALPQAAPNGFNSLPDLGGSIDMDAFNSVVSVQGHYDEIRVRNHGQLLIDESYGNMYSCGNLRLESGGRLTISGDVHLLVKQNAEIDDADITLDDGASLTLYVAQNLTVDNRAKIGIAPEDVDSGTASVTTYVNPGRFRLFALAPSAGGSSNPVWRIRSQSVAVGSLYCPHGTVLLDSNAALFGRATAKDLALKSGCRLYYCPTLDSRMGFTEPTGPLYSDDGTPIDGLLDVLDDVVSTVPSTVDDFSDTFDELWDDYVINLGGSTGGSTSGGSQTQTQKLLNNLLPVL